ncbi:hypothetical protein [Sphingobacterium psychroaquaticum]|uniref:Uncharacterized protein n=1 Tax=Sphingobacterium psychroaquaticum TaxID=561061 RepID=A0A1X7HVX7_9SPHI|nr:hypothetical protein [Sphingobacterium psychroaquaticum]SMG06162.1 hypothetical protein SAMN05660862_0123 [Sphingobacterium psychroaquaticum]
MNYYFALQYRIAKRSIEEVGVPFWVGMLVLIGLLIAGYFICQRFPDYADLLLLYTGTSFLLTQTGSQRIDFLKTTFPEKKFRKVRLCESLLYILPLVILAGLVGAWFALGILPIAAYLFAMNTLTFQTRRSFPTPFRKYPFEFIILFRKFFWLFVALYGLGAIGIYVDNFNLSIFAAAVIILVAVGDAYSVIEPEEILWSNSRSPDRFLGYKIGRGAIQLSGLILPLLTLMSFFFREQTPWIALCWIIGCLLLALMVVLKYKSYPKPIGLIEGFSFVICIFIPILVFALFPYYYSKAKKNIQIVYDRNTTA